MESILVKLLKNNEKTGKKELDKYIEKLAPSKETIITFLNNCHYDLLYSGSIHGAYHSEKVVFYAYILGLEEHLNKDDMKLILDAAFYHDVGRENNLEDSIHGYSSTNILQKNSFITDQEFYKEQENLNILCAIIDGHSLPDTKKDTRFAVWDVKDIARASKLYNILKDADALDRKRFISSCKASLDEHQLRNPVSKKLVLLAQEINEYYNAQMNQKNSIVNNSKEEAKIDCFHSIGFDFFKIPSVLEEGILCNKKIKEKNLDFPPNFLGGNSMDWISVVDVSTLGENVCGSRAFNEFTKHGIGFYCVVDSLQEAMPKSKKDIALEKGLPYNKSDYIDEKYVRGEIKADNILSIIVPEGYKDRDIRELNYIYNSLETYIMDDRINYYINKTSSNNSVLAQKLLIQKQKYCNVVDTFNATYSSEMDNGTKDILKNNITQLLDLNRVEMNSTIASMVYGFYKNKIQNDNITVMDVVNYELRNYDFDLVSTANEVVLINNMPKKDSSLKR